MRTLVLASDARRDVLTVDGNVARLEGNDGRFVEYEATGVYRMRLGRVLADGRTVWLDLGGGGLGGENLARAQLTREKLESAVYAARYWKGMAVSRAQQMSALAASRMSFGLLGAGLIGYVLGKAKGDKSP